MKRWGRKVLGPAFLGLFIATLWCVVYGRTSTSAWATPLLYESDAWSLLAQVKVASEGWLTPLGVRTIPSLNAPFGANWNDYPRQNKLLLWLMGIVSRRLGLFVTVNLAFLLAHILAGLSFYFVARWLRWRPEWAAALACVFSFSHYMAARGLKHLVLCLYWHVPLCILVVAWVLRPGRSGSEKERSRLVLAVLIAAIAALQSVYYALLFAQFLVIAALAQALRRRGRSAVLRPLAPVGVIAAILVVDSAHVVVYAIQHGPNLAAVQRSQADVQRYALRPVDLALPPPGMGLAHWGSLVDSYWNAGSHGEGTTAYLGLVGLAGLALLVGGPLGGALRRRRVVLPGALLALLWILAFSVVGGVNSLVAAVGFAFLRGSNRYSIWILTLALLALGRALSRASLSVARPVSVVAAVLVAGIALADQLPDTMHADEVQATRARVDADRRFVATLEATLRPGAMVFMLPVLDFPEVPPVHRHRDYEHFRPFFFSSRLRFSYGTDKGRPRDAWQKRVAALAPAEMARALEAFGFAGVILSRRGYRDGGEAVLEGLAAAGCGPSLGSGDLVFVRLQPVAAPASPLW